MSESAQQTDIIACLVNLCELLDDELRLRELVDLNPTLWSSPNDRGELLDLASKYDVELHNELNDLAQEVLVKLAECFVGLALELKALHDAEVPESPAMQAFIEALGGNRVLTDEEFRKEFPTRHAMSRLARPR